ncbi:hypothetical protein JNM05_09765 [bacterium]|nr:hypothetical protein [bacterium]
MSYTFLDLAEEVLKSYPRPITYQEIWEIAVATKLDSKVRISGKTPWQTLGARLYVDVRDNENSPFIKVGRNPAKFFLRSRSSEVLKDANETPAEEISPRKETSSFPERDLHPLVSYYAYANLAFNRGRSIYTKTIFHEKSRKTGYTEWTHPDLVGFYLPLEDWNEHLIELNKISDNSSLKIYSFEVKKVLSRSNYRESFFQAVSNSSWANEGYLVAPELQEDDDLLSELERLSMSFGIGIIHLDLEDFDSSKVIYPARVRETMDWDTMNKLCENNTDFSKFIQDIRIDFESKRIHKGEYDVIMDDPDSYIRKLRKK